MRSRAARWTFVTLTWIALGGAAYFLFTSQIQISMAAAGLRTFDLRAREAVSALAALRTPQPPYAAPGGALVILLLAPGGKARGAEPEASGLSLIQRPGDSELSSASPARVVAAPPAPPAPRPTVVPPSTPRTTPVLKAAADLATD